MSANDSRQGCWPRLSALRSRLVVWAKRIKTEVGACFLAARDGRTPLLAKAVAVVVVVYALSPIDLIPDFIPIIGLVDDLLLLPVGLWIVIRLVPPDLMAEFRKEAQGLGRLPRSFAGAAFVIGLWLAMALLAGWLVYRNWIVPV